MKPEFKISNIRATSQTRDLTEDTHISNFIHHQPSSSNGYLNTIKKTLLNTGIKEAYLLFDLQGKTWWCKEPEYVALEYAFKNCIKEINLHYVAGSSQPLVKANDYSISGIDGYEMIVGFN